MSPEDQRLLRHLLVAVLAKLMALTALWWGLVHDQPTVVNAEQAASHLGTPSTPAGDRP